MQQTTPQPFAITLNPNQPPPIVLSSSLPPPPVWPLPQTDWVVLPPVPPGFPVGPFQAQLTSQPGQQQQLGWGGGGGGAPPGPPRPRRRENTRELMAPNDPAQ